MRAVSLLEFLNSAKDVCSLEYDECFHPADILSLINEDEQFVQRINFGIIYVHTKIQDKYTIIGGLSGIISLSLLLHAVCECYKKTSPRNDSAIRTIRSKYLLNNKRSKLRLKTAAQELYDKIINHERLSGREKDSKMFKLLHKFWSDIKENKLQAAHIFKMLQRVFVTIVDAVVRIPPVVFRQTEVVVPVVLVSVDIHVPPSDTDAQGNHVLVGTDFQLVKQSEPAGVQVAVLGDGLAFQQLDVIRVGQVDICIIQVAVKNFVQVGARGGGYTHAAADEHS